MRSSLKEKKTLTRCQGTAATSSRTAEVPSLKEKLRRLLITQDAATQLMTTGRHGPDSARGQKPRVRSPLSFSACSANLTALRRFVNSLRAISGWFESLL